MIHILQLDDQDVTICQQASSLMRPVAGDLVFFDIAGGIGTALVVSSEETKGKRVTNCLVQHTDIAMQE